MGRGAEGGVSLVAEVLVLAFWAVFAALLIYFFSMSAWLAVPIGLPLALGFIFLAGSVVDLLDKRFYKGPAPRWQTQSPVSESQFSAAMRVEHIGIATPKIEESLKFWRDALGLEVRHTEVVEEQGVRVAMLPVGEPRIELLEPTGPDSPVAKFLAKRGPGIHHVAVRVADIRAALARLKTEGARLIDEEPRVGAGGCLVAFVHPSSAGGVLLELVEHAPESEPAASERQ